MSSLLNILPAQVLSPILHPMQLAFAKINPAKRSVRNALLPTVLQESYRFIARALVYLVPVWMLSNSATTSGAVRRTASSIAMLDRMAAELETQQPQLAAELRLLAARG